MHPGTAYIIIFGLCVLLLIAGLVIIDSSKDNKKAIQNLEEKNEALSINLKKENTYAINAVAESDKRLNEQRRIADDKEKTIERHLSKIFEMRQQYENMYVTKLRLIAHIDNFPYDYEFIQELKRFLSESGYQEIQIAGLFLSGTNNQIVKAVAKLVGEKNVRHNSPPFRCL
jgi:flagellar biosynthesis component FlhA